ncbi:hypothetical protein WMY93_001841 [Mugilogobius chulae]|uniref:Uncharacterized protein n=1 Tax=Mugilogobius chulae TaxID=88201 RepID=A0AAW0PSI1_9GOBI
MLCLGLHSESSDNCRVEEEKGRIVRRVIAAHGKFGKRRRIKVHTINSFCKRKRQPKNLLHTSHGETTLCTSHEETTLCTSHGETTLCRSHRETLLCISHGETTLCISHGETTLCLCHCETTLCLCHCETTLCLCHCETTLCISHEETTLCLCHCETTLCLCHCETTLCTSHEETTLCTSHEETTLCTSHGETTLCTSHGETTLCTSHGETTLCTSHGETTLCTSHGETTLCTSHGETTLCTSHGETTLCTSHGETTLCRSHSETLLYTVKRKSTPSTASVRQKEPNPRRDSTPATVRRRTASAKATHLSASAAVRLRSASATVRRRSAMMRLRSATLRRRSATLRLRSASILSTPVTRRSLPSTRVQSELSTAVPRQSTTATTTQKHKVTWTTVKKKNSARSVPEWKGLPPIKGIPALGTVQLNRLPGCTFTDDKTMKKSGRGALEEKQAVVEGIELRAVKWLSVAEALCMQGKDLMKRKRGRPSVEIDKEHEAKRSKGPTKAIPAKEIRTDSVGHWVVVEEKRQRCLRKVLQGGDVTALWRGWIRLSAAQNVIGSGAKFSLVWEHLAQQQLLICPSLSVSLLGNLHTDLRWQHKVTVPLSDSRLVSSLGCPSDRIARFTPKDLCRNVQQEVPNVKHLSSSDLCIDANHAPLSRLLITRNPHFSSNTIPIQPPPPAAQGIDAPAHPDLCSKCLSAKLDELK